MKQGTRVSVEMVNSKTADRADRHNKVVGTLLVDLLKDGMLLVMPTKESDSPKGIATTQIQSLNKTDDGLVFIQTMNTLYKLEVIND